MSATYSYSGKRQCEIGALASTTGTNCGAPALQYSVAETFGVVLPGFRKFDDLASYDFVGNVAAINKPKRYRCHFICEAHDPEGLWVKLLAIEVRSDRHMRPPVPGGRSTARSAPDRLRQPLSVIQPLYGARRYLSVWFQHRHERRLGRQMALKLRPTGLGSGIDKDRADYTVVTGEWKVGRIYETRGGPTICAGSGR